MDHRKFYEDHYFSELERKEKLKSDLQIPIAIITIIGGLLGFFIKNFTKTGDLHEYFFWVLIIIAVIALVGAIYFLYRSYYSYTYRYIAPPKQLKDYYDGLADYYKINQGQTDEADKEFEAYIKERYAACAEVNRWNNNAKSAFLHKANTWLIGAVVSALISAIPYFWPVFQGKEKVQQVKILGLESILKRLEVIMPNEKEKPKPPPDQEVKEGAVPKKPKPEKDTKK